MTSRLRTILLLGVLAISTGCEEKTTHSNHTPTPVVQAIAPEPPKPVEIDLYLSRCDHRNPDSDLGRRCCYHARDMKGGALMVAEWDRRARSYLYGRLSHREENKEYELARGELFELRFAWGECRGNKELYERIKTEHKRMRTLMRTQQ